MIGLERGIVRLVPCQPDWAIEFEREAARLKAALGDRVGRFEHMGSTAIQGMPAKPIIDFMGSVEHLDNVPLFMGDLAALGYEWDPRDRQDVPDRYYFVRRSPDGLASTHHFSLAEVRSDWWQRQLLFRDCLRASPRLHAAYARFKQGLVRRYSTERGKYTDAKTGFVQAVLRRAHGPHTPA